MAKYYFDDKKTFINPYNFVPNQGKKTTINEPSEKERLHTGVMHCRLISKTPLIIPDTSEREEIADVPEHYRYPFMQIDGKDAIPASSLRGPIRSVYEALTNSCYATTKEDYKLYNRAQRVFKPGLLKKNNGQWKLYEADRYCIMKNAVKTWEYGQRIIFKEDIDKQERYRKFAKDASPLDKGGHNGYLSGYLFIGEYIATKKYESIFRLKKDKWGNDIEACCKNNNIGSEELEKALKHLKNILKYYHDSEQSCGSDDSGTYRNYRHIKDSIFNEENRYIPVWYEYNPEDKAPHLSFASIGRYEYENTLNDVLGTFDACKSWKERCAACDLFGMVGTAKKESAAAGKVRFTDAFLNEGEGGEKEEVDLRELGAPHISYLPFYMENAMSYDGNGARIRGRKFYWHHNPDPELYKAQERSKLNDTMEYVQKDSTFSFSVYYDRVTDKQLRELMYVLCLGENDRESSMCHKIGHAKPLGFGSVKIVIDRRMERTYSRDDGYSIKETPVDDDWFGDVFDSETDTMRAMTAIANFNTIQEIQVRYPYVEPFKDPKKTLDENVLASHQWYSINYPFGKKNARYNLAQADVGENALPMPRVTAGKFTERDYKKYKGKIKYIDKNKGFGFIKPDEGGENLYFHMSNAIDFDGMKKGDPVSYQQGKDGKGRNRAVNVIQS